MSERAGASDDEFWDDGDEGEALQRYRTLVNAIDDGIYQLDAEGRFVAVNDVITELSGYDREELLGEHVSTLLDADDVTAVEREIERRLTADAQSDTVEFTVETDDGDRVPCELRLNLLVDEGQFRGTIGVVRDVSERVETERELGERERQLERERDLTAEVIDASPVGVMVLDAEGKITRVNDRATELLGVPDEEVAGYDPSDRPAYDEEGRPVAVEDQPFAEALRTGEPVYDRVLQVEHPDGGRRWLSVNAEPILDGDGEVVRVVTTGEDVTDIKRRERELESELGEIIGRVTDAFYALDDEWRFTHANERAEQLIDYRGEGLVGRKLWDVFEWATDSKLGDEYREAMATQEPTAFEFYYPDPLEAWYDVRAYPSETGLSVYFRDVTERKRRERELEEYRSRYRTLVENFPNGAVALVDRDLRYVTFGGTPEVDEVTRGDLEGSYLREELPCELADVVVPCYESALDGESVTIEESIGDEAYKFHFLPVRDDDGEVFAALGMSQNVTERREYQRQLEESERRYRTLAENFPDGGVTLFDRDLEYTLAAGRGFADVPVDPDDFEGRNVREVWDDEVADELEPAFEAALDGEERSFELAYAGRDWNLYVVPITDERGDVFAGMTMTQDITERKERERQLRRYREYTDAVLDAIDDVFYILDESGDLQRYNDSLSAVTGYRPDEVASMHALDFFDEESHEKIVDAIRRGFETGHTQVEAEIRTNDGDRVPYEFVASALEDPDGERVLAGIGRDVSERIERERKLEETVEKLEESNERLESFASMLAHELRNPVTIGQIYAGQLPADDADSSEAVEYVAEAFDRIEDMIDVMLVLTRGRDAVGAGSSLALSAVARDAWDEIDAPDATLDARVGAVVEADETYLRHLFRNLFENAVQHGGATRVEVGEIAGGEGFYVADDGTGIPAEEREQVFEAGFTTAGDEGGTGLGLAFVRELAEVYGWDPRVTESASGGARIEFRGVDSATEE
ncbi:PAS domain S-box protein [Halorussus salinus]|uniref:PAS domain S-box protein n=1 Tax=Halorussus salinus TaxID=1364935 RepID=UPI001092B076|nr:PAS domain S-box protein [Halorussus salinus]